MIQATNYQKRTAKRKIMLLLFLLVVGLFILLLIKPKKHHDSPPPEPAGGSTPDHADSALRSRSSFVELDVRIGTARHRWMSGDGDETEDAPNISPVLDRRLRYRRYSRAEATVLPFRDVNIALHT